METSSSLDAETKRMIEDSLDRFVDDAYEPSTRRARLQRDAVDYRAHWPTLAELGVLALPVPEALGGIGGSALDLSDAMRVLARGMVLEPLIECAVIAGAVLRHGPQAVEATAELISGDKLTVLVGGRRGDHLRAQRSGDQLRLTGKARVVPGAGSADLWLIAAVDVVGEPIILRVAAPDVHARVQSYRLMDGSGAADIDFDNVVVPKASIWIEGEPARQALAAAAAQAVCAYSAEAAGAMQCLVRTTGEYLRTREQFGVALGTFQALQHRFADMHMATLEARAIAREMARSIDARDSARIEWLRYAASTVLRGRAERVGHEAIQMHGGMGVTDELVVGHYNARLVVLNKLLAGWTPEVLDERAAVE